MNNKTWLGWLFALGATLAFSTSLPVGRMAMLSGMDATYVVATRFGMATLLLWLTFWAGQLNVASARQLAKKETMFIDRAPIDRAGMLMLIVTGILSGTSTSLIFLALSQIESSITAIIFSTLPIFTLVILAFQGETLTGRKLLRLALAIVGVYLLIGGPSGEANLLGVSLAFLGIILLAIQLVMIQPLTRQYDSQTVTRYNVTTVAVVVSLFWWIEQQFINPTPAVRIQWQAYWPSAEEWLYILILGVVATYAARLMLYAAIRFVGTGQMALLTPLETLMSITWAVIFLGERLSVVQWIGGALILCSALLAIQRRSVVAAEASG